MVAHSTRALSLPLCQVIRFPLETCSSSANCSSCVTNGDPLCVWCSVESKCSRRSQCRSNNETLRYLTQGNQSNCMNTVTFDPLQFMSGLESVPYQVSCHMSPVTLCITARLLCRSTYHSLRAVLLPHYPRRHSCVCLVMRRKESPSTPLYHRICHATSPPLSLRSLISS